MKLKKDSSEQKLRGAYYTPLPLANGMVRLFAAENINSILEPSCGDGVFIDSLRDQGLINQFDNITAVEIDKVESEKVQKKHFDYMQLEIVNQDFFCFYNDNVEKRKFDLILGNPPYIRYQYLSEEQREILSKILLSQGMKANKLVNAWVGFIVACTQFLSENGRIALVIPAEILQVAYAEDLRLFLSNQYTRITLITFEKLVFPEIEQEVVVFIGEKGGEEKGIRTIELNDLSDFDTKIGRASCRERV